MRRSDRDGMSRTRVAYRFIVFSAQQLGRADAFSTTPTTSGGGLVGRRLEDLALLVVLDGASKMS